MDDFQFFCANFWHRNILAILCRLDSLYPAYMLHDGIYNIGSLCVGEKGILAD